MGTEGGKSGKTDYYARGSNELVTDTALTINRLEKVRQGFRIRFFIFSPSGLEQKGHN